MKRAKATTTSSVPTKLNKEETADTLQSRSQSQFIESLEQHRKDTAVDVRAFKFNKRRLRVLTTVADVRESSQGGILYWMSRDARVHDNWALLFAQRLALRVELPLLVAFSLVPKFLNATRRHYEFLLAGLKEVERDCLALNIPFCLLLGPAAQCIPQLVTERDLGGVICDFSPLRQPREWVEAVRLALPNDVPLVQVDAHNVVPVWIASDKQEYAARTIRNKINSKLNEFLTEFPPLIEHPHTVQAHIKAVNWSEAYNSLECEASTPVGAVDWAKPGYAGACAQLESFCQQRLPVYEEKRNDPTQDALSGLSPWFHFGHISVQRCVLEVQRQRKKFKAAVEAFCEEAIVRRELSDNFCYYNEHYDSLKGAPTWAQKTLADHSEDKRNPCYTLPEFEGARTHDDLWNSAQLQLVREAKLHGFLRMYWAKKILEWSATPEEALQHAILLNDKYSLDGRDPNGYVGCLWSIGGVHDMGWKERAIFGKVRYMNYQGCKRKFDVAAFVKRYGGRAYTKK